MAILMEKYNKILELINNDNLAWIRHSGVPFIICPYGKEEHEDTIHIIDKLKQDIQDYKIEVINIEHLIFDIIEEFETIEGIIEFEKSEEDINLVNELGELLLEEIRIRLIGKADELGSDGRIIIARIGSTAIYFNFIRLLSYLEGRIQIPVVFFYPGVHDKYSVKLLDKYKETSLRALIV